MTSCARQGTVGATRATRQHPLRLHLLKPTYSPIISTTIPKTQNAAFVVFSDAPIVVKGDHPVKQPEELAAGECLISIHCAGVCHMDLHARKGDWPSPYYSSSHSLVGTKVFGEVVFIGAHTINSPVKIGDRVGVNGLADSCLRCGQLAGCANTP
jgi:alcohol dehydrogenase, propanol-preferring